ncbi:hypothetical protein QG083_01645 [Kingella kingae]|nr:hypothetical protein [Kingella kingae]MBD3614357.1 hypothetical protein [Kingella kingae]MBD3632606.1 hypothetical protein [Kingella kingae]MBD3659999.1 hypothetical protein [Kingella kingae]MDK4526259.1 hypothetical protein [Kingella kingae]MDK4532471.1 hypothetical protein [Kingella kingae]
MSNPYQNSNGTFENKLGIQKADELKLIEYDLTTQKSNQILNDEVSLGVKG